MFEGSKLSHGHFRADKISFSENIAFSQIYSDFFIFLQIFWKENRVSENFRKKVPHHSHTHQIGWDVPWDWIDKRRQGRGGFPVELEGRVRDCGRGATRSHRDSTVTISVEHTCIYVLHVYARIFSELLASTCIYVRSPQQGVSICTYDLEIILAYLHVWFGNHTCRRILLQSRQHTARGSHLRAYTYNIRTYTAEYI